MPPISKRLILVSITLTPIPHTDSTSNLSRHLGLVKFYESLLCVWFHSISANLQLAQLLIRIVSYSNSSGMATNAIQRLLVAQWYRRNQKDHRPLRRGDATSIE